HGHGPLPTWRGEAALQVEGIGSLQGEISRQPADHPLWQFQGQLQGERTFLGATWTEILTAPTAKKAATADNVTVQVAGELAWWPGERWQLTRLALTAETLHGTGEGVWQEATKQLQGNLRLSMPQANVLTPLLGHPVAGSLHTVLSLHGSWPHPSWQLTTQADKVVLAGWQAERLTARWQGEWHPAVPQIWRGEGEITAVRQTGGGLHLAAPWQWRAELQTERGKGVQLTRLSLHDPDNQATWQGQLDLLQATGAGKWQWQSRHLEHWLRHWQPDWNHGQGAGELSGTWRVTTEEGRQAVAGRRVQLALEGALTQLQGLPAALQTLLGDRLTTQARLQWQSREGWRLEDLRLQGAHLQGKGEGRGDAEWQRQSGQLQLRVAQLQPWSQQAGIPLQGDLQAELRWEGALTAPRLQTTLQGGQWQAGGWHWQKPHVVCVVESWHSGPRGTLTADLPGGERQQTLPLTAMYRVTGSSIQFTDLKLEWPGGKLSSDAWQVDWQKRLADGRWQGNSNTPGEWLHWLTAGALSAPADLQGSLNVQLQWQGQGGEQQLQLVGDSHTLRGSFGMLDKAVLKADLHNLWGEMRGRVDGKINKLHWGKLQLRNASWVLNGEHRVWTFHSTGSGVIRQGETEALSSLPIPVARAALKPIKQEAIDWEMQSTMTMDGKGVIHGTLRHLSGHIGADAVQLHEPAQILLTPGQRREKADWVRVELSRLQLSYGPARLQMQLRFDAQQVDMEGELRLPLSLVHRVGGPDLQGNARAHWRVTGSSSQPDGEFSLSLEKLHINEPALEAVPPATLQATVRLLKGQLESQISLQDLTSQPVTALVALPVQLSFVPWKLALPPTGALSGTLQADAQLAQFALMAAPGLMDSQKLTGLLNIALQFAGTVAAPEVNGTIVVHNGSYENGSLGTQLKQINLDIRANGRTLTIDRLEANDGGQGRMRATGALTLDWNQRLPYHLQATIEKSMLVRRDEWQATVSGPLELQGNWDKMTVTGAITGNEVLLYLADSESLDIQTVAVDSEIRNGLHIAAVPRLKATSTPVYLNLQLHLPSRFFLRGRGLESEWQGDLQVQGMVDEPRLDGRITVKRGYFEFLDQRFDLRKGIIAFDGASPPQPNLDLEAESRSNGGMMAVLRLQGPAFNPTLTLGSDPELPQDELLARILFNRNRQQLTPAQAVGLAVAVEKLRSGGPGLLGKARESIGIDRLEFGGESVEAGSVKAGKYLSDNLLLGVERGVKQGSGKVSVELEVLPNVVLQTEMDETNKSGVGVNWKMDY
ncbi:MAG: translocation/assembly module TamB domain-containing protein, partial [Magnetococcales bacterium]|nr:translocation/assembly module TamB domain-containing protein [Magnetococcales bacterium]